MKKVNEMLFFKKGKSESAHVHVCARACVWFVDEVRDVQMQLTKNLLWMLLTIKAFLLGDFQLE